jgi:RND family efflux transporter MFP subunit
MSPFTGQKPGLTAPILVAVLFSFLAGCGDPQLPDPPPRKVKAVKLGGVSDLAERSFPGRARAAQEVNLSFRVSGPLVDLPVNVGDEVTQGQLLAQIDPTDYESRVKAVRGELQSGIAARDLAQAEFQRAADIKKTNPDLISDSEYDQRLGKRDTTRAKVIALESALKLAEDDLAYTSLLAPFDGVVAAKYVENFENVLAKRPILRLLDSERIEVVIDVPERQIGYVPYLVSATVSFDALPGVELGARVKEVGNESSAVTRTYPVTLIMDQPEGQAVRPGMAASVRLVGRLPSDAREVGLSIPATALFNKGEGDGSFVFVVDESTMALEERAVEVSMLSDAGVLVKSGLETGEWLVIAGVHSLSDGQTVRILDANTGETLQ